MHRSHQLALKMDSHGFLEVRKGSMRTFIQTKYQTKYWKTATDCSSIRRWSQEHQTRCNHVHIGRHGRSWIIIDVKDRIGEIFIADLTLNLRIAAIEIEIHHTTIWRFLREELKLFPYKLRTSRNQWWGQY